VLENCDDYFQEHLSGAFLRSLLVLAVSKRNAQFGQGNSLTASWPALKVVGRKSWPRAEHFYPVALDACVVRLVSPALDSFDMLHHYTTVNTLALILERLTLRFTRLDQFDDVTEGRSTGQFPLGARSFASCWSAAQEESIPQWMMYGDGMKGVRVSITSDPFIWHPININWHEKFVVDALEAPFSLEEMLAPNIVLIPTVDMRKTFGQRVRYVADVEMAIARLYSDPVPDEVTFFGNGTEIAYFKHDNWEFQEEYRFVITAMPGPETQYQGDPAAYIETWKIWGSGINLMKENLNPTYVDIRLDPQALRSAQFLVGPLAPAGTLEAVEELVSRFAEGATVGLSNLDKLIRPRK